MGSPTLTVASCAWHDEILHRNSHHIYNDFLFLFNYFLKILHGAVFIVWSNHIKFVTCKCIMYIRYVHDDPCFSKFSRTLFPGQLDFNIKRKNHHKYIWAVSVWWESCLIFHTGYWWNTSSWGNCNLANERGKRRC